MAALGFVLVQAFTEGRRILAFSNAYGVLVDPPAAAAFSATGYDEGRRSLLISGDDNRQWIMQAQAMQAEGRWRLRHVDYDNAPQGRDVHWAQPGHRWLMLLAACDRAFTGRPAGLAIERVALWSSPLLLGLTLLTLSPVLARTFAPSAAALVAVGSVAVFPFASQFAPGTVDHHGCASVCACGCVLFLVAAFGPDSTANRNRRCWVIGSALFGGIGLWISASTMVPVLAGIGIGAVVAIWCGRGSDGGTRWVMEPTLFRWWSIAGALTSGVGYVVEYFPDHLGWRLEVNHPLYALAWYGGGEFLTSLARLSGEPGRRSSPGRMLVPAAGLAAVLAVPAVILVARARVFLAADPFLVRLFGSDIAELQSLGSSLRHSGFAWGWWQLCLPMLLLVPPLVLALRRKTAPETRGLMLLALVPAIVVLGLGWYQLRWLGLAFALSIPVWAEFLRVVRLADGRYLLIWTGTSLALLVPGTIDAWQRVRAAEDESTADIRTAMLRDVAHWLRQRAGKENAIIAAAPSTTTALAYFGSHRGLGTLYWENLEGLKTAAALFSASTPEEARAIVRRTGINYIVHVSWDPFDLGYVRLARGATPDDPLPGDALAVRLLKEAVPPPWLRAIPVPMPDHPALRGESVQVWQVCAEQTPLLALAHAIAFRLETGDVDGASHLAGGLDHESRDPVVLAMRATMQARAGQVREFALTVDQLELATRQTSVVALDDRLAVVVALVAGRRFDHARAELQKIVARMGESDLRHLSAGMLSDLLALTQGLDVAWPDPAMRELAISLVPPMRRQK